MGGGSEGGIWRLYYVRKKPPVNETKVKKAMKEVTSKRTSNTCPKEWSVNTID